jgi:hypothetical protein
MLNFYTLNLIELFPEKQFFTQENPLNNLIEKILIPLICLNEEVIFYFNESPFEYFQKDIEGLESENLRNLFITF